MENDMHEDKRTENTFIVKESKTTEVFQKFFYELFEKNGVLNDLRAYLRGHIINILKNVEKGETLPCQKHFTQRLENNFQAINMLVAEYLMRMDFTYSLSVFISEVPLANMVFDFAQSLLGCKPDESCQELRFKDEDVWRILNYIGVKCDSNSATNIVNMYRKEESSLLMCILKCIDLYKYQLHVGMEDMNDLRVGVSSSSSLSGDDQKSNINKRPETMTCKHVSFCSSCKQNIREFQVQYKKKKRKLRMNLKSPDSDLVNVQMFLRDMDVTERNIIEEMFEQLKTVYEAEVDMVREEEERKIKRSLANHSLLLQKRYEEMEESFKARETALKCNTQQKKKFLWGLARALREQHSNMADAMRAVQKESERLTAKEESLQHQISEAEQTLKRKGDEMRDQISSELIILQGHLNSMRKQRVEIDRERTELEKLKEICTSNTKIASDNIKETELLHTNYDILTNELLDLKKCLTVTKIDKCYIDRGVMTENAKLISNAMNNEQEFGKNAKSDDSLKTANHLVNNLKKRKNVNFNQVSLEESITDRNRGRHFEFLMQENERLKAFADQQHRHIEELTRDRLVLQSQLGIGLSGSMCIRPRTAPPSILPVGINPSGVGFESGCRKGGGEELSIFPSPTRPLVPGDELPFVGVLPDRRTDTRRHLIKQWRSLRRSLIAGEVVSPKAGTSRQDNPEDTSIPWPLSPQTVISANVTLDNPKCDQDGRIHQKPDPAVELNKGRVKSPKSVLREAKQKLRKKGGKNCVKRQPDVITREKSPNTTLREAKLRLRKLEIEAEAVERSYLDFRRRQSKETDDGFVLAQNVEFLSEAERNNDVHHRISFQKEPKDETHRSVHNLYTEKSKELLTKDFDKYLREYQTKQNVEETHKMSLNYKPLKNKLIPSKYSNITQDLEAARQNFNYLETPLTEFRKFYHNEKPRQNNIEHVIQKSTSLNTQKVERKKDKNKPTQPQTNTEGVDAIKTLIENVDENIPIVNEPKLNSSNEFKILQERLNDTCEPSNEQILSIKAHAPSIEPVIEKSLRNTTNLLKVEVENVTETNNLTITDQDGCTIVLESSVDTNVLKYSQNNIRIDSPMTVILSPGVKTPREIRLETQGIEKLKHTSPNHFDSSNAVSDKLCKNATMPKLSVEKDELEPIDITKDSLTQEQAANLIRNDALHDNDVKAIQDGSNFHVDNENIKNEVNSLNGTEGDFKYYPDDFSADVDNYESRSELSNSPISLPKTSEEENFWD